MQQSSLQCLLVAAPALEHEVFITVTYFTSALHLFGSSLLMGLHFDAITMCQAIRVELNPCSWVCASGQYSTVGL